MECVAEVWEEAASVEPSWSVTTSSVNQLYKKDDRSGSSVLSDIANGMKTGRRYSLSEIEYKQYTCRSVLVDSFKSQSAYFSREYEIGNKKESRLDHKDNGGGSLKYPIDIFRKVNIVNNESRCSSIDNSSSNSRVTSVEGDRQSALAGSCPPTASTVGSGRRTHEFARSVDTRNVHFNCSNVSLDNVNTLCDAVINNGPENSNRINSINSNNNLIENPINNETDVKCVSVNKQGDVMRPVRTRRTGVVTSPILERREFPCVERLVAKYTQLIAQQMERSQMYNKKKLHASEGDLKNVIVKSNDDDSNNMKEEKEVRSVSQNRTYLALPTPRRSKRRSSCQSPSTVSDEGCSVAPSPNSPTSSEEDASFNNKRSVSSDSALGFLYNSDDDEKKRNNVVNDTIEQQRIVDSNEVQSESVTNDDNDDSNRISKTHTNLNRSVSMPTPGSPYTKLGGVLTARSEVTLCKERWLLLESGSEYGASGPFPESGWSDGSRRISDFSEFDGSTSDSFNGRRESSVSVFTDDDDGGNPGYRYWRTPSVVVSDHSDDPLFASSSITLEEIERFRQQYQERQAADSSSDCSSWTSGVSALDADYALRTPERKASDCSTCSTLSGDEDATCEPLLQDVRPKVKKRNEIEEGYVS
ncbi:uncharacterized protein LOC142330848 [Lycorma delicatula]|uniref:uncharacterized protein LOC142330848 n=1 Tax=Lycorma delicatula TaxID=130591 RepID=UPI003F5149D8